MFLGVKSVLCAKKQITHSFEQLRNICKHVQKTSIHISRRSNFAILGRSKGIDIISRDGLTCRLGLRKIMLLGPGIEVPEKLSFTTLIKSFKIIGDTILLARLNLNQRYVDKPVLPMGT